MSGFFLFKLEANIFNLFSFELTQCDRKVVHDKKKPHTLFWLRLLSITKDNYSFVIRCYQLLTWLMEFQRVQDLNICVNPQDNSCLMCFSTNKELN